MDSPSTFQEAGAHVLFATLSALRGGRRPAKRVEALTSPTDATFSATSDLLTAMAFPRVSPNEVVRGLSEMLSRSMNWLFATMWPTAAQQSLFAWFTLKSTSTSEGGAPAMA